MESSGSSDLWTSQWAKQIESDQGFAVCAAFLSPSFRGVPVNTELPCEGDWHRAMFSSICDLQRNPGRPWAFGRGSSHPRQQKCVLHCWRFSPFWYQLHGYLKGESQSLILVVKKFLLRAGCFLWKVNWKRNNPPQLSCLPGPKVFYLSRAEGIWAKALEISLHPTPFSAAQDKCRWTGGGKGIREKDNRFDGKRSWWIKDWERSKNEMSKWEG